MPEHPLSDAELRIVRGMIDEYRYEQENRLHRRITLQHWHVWFAVLCTIVLLSLQVITLIDTAKHL